MDVVRIPQLFKNIFEKKKRLFCASSNLIFNKFRLEKGNQKRANTQTGARLADYRKDNKKVRVNASC